MVTLFAKKRTLGVARIRFRRRGLPCSSGGLRDDVRDGPLITAQYKYRVRFDGDLAVCVDLSDKNSPHVGLKLYLQSGVNDDES